MSLCAHIRLYAFGFLDGLSFQIPQTKESWKSAQPGKDITVIPVQSDLFSLCVCVREGESERQRDRERQRGGGVSQYFLNVQRSA